MKNVLFVIMLIISLVFGGISSYTNENNVITQSVKVAIFPTGISGETYLINLKSDGELEVSMGERTNDNISSDDVNRGDFLNVLMKESKKLTNEQLVEIDKLLKQLESVKAIYNNRLTTDAWKVVVNINNKIFDYYYYRIDHINDSLEGLVNKLIEYSPLKVDLHGWT